MDYDERSIRIFLKGYPGQFLSARVIGRRLGGRRRYHENPLWAMPILAKLVEKGIVEIDSQGHYRLKKVEPTDRRKRPWISPQVRRILDKSSRDFSHVLTTDEDDDDLL